MKKIINVRTAGNILLVAFGLLAVFHLLVIFEVVSSGMVWGGQAAGSASTGRTLEIISLVATVLFGLVVTAKLDYIVEGRFRQAIRILLWIIFAYLLLNALGNLASGVSVENLIFAPISVLMALLVLRLAIEK